MLENGNIRRLDRLNTRRLQPSHLQAFHRESRLPNQTKLHIRSAVRARGKRCPAPSRSPGKGRHERVLVFFDIRRCCRFSFLDHLPAWVSVKRTTSLKPFGALKWTAPDFASIRLDIRHPMLYLWDGTILFKRNRVSLQDFC